MKAFNLIMLAATIVAFALLVIQKQRLAESEAKMLNAHYNLVVATGGAVK